MDKDFNKKLLFDNISFLLKESGKKIGELESFAGVSPGYISRSKEGSTKPGIDFVVKAAEYLGTSVDTLINMNMSTLTPTEEYLLSFLGKLKKDTIADKLEWKIESADSLNRLEVDYDGYVDGYVDHPLFSKETFLEQNESPYPSDVTRVVMVSNSFGCHTGIAGDCYNLRLKNGTKLYLMNICKSVFQADDRYSHAKEIWMYKPNSNSQFICSNFQNQVFSGIIDDLYVVIAEMCKHPKINAVLKTAIDAFMIDDLCDDPVDFDDLDIPF